jgi:SAM-dependent methyltransferase
MPELLTNCPLCGGLKHNEFNRTQFRGQPVINQICQDCGFVFQSPRMAPAELDDFYQAEYRQVYQGASGPTPKDLKIQSGRAQSLLSFIKKQVPDIERHLDIGCSAGLLLEKFSQHYHCLPVGVEPGQAYRAYAENKGLRVYPSLEVLSLDQQDKFDLISMAHVLEHVPEPLDYLVNLREKYLRLGGYLLIEVPNLFCHDCFEIAHMSSFSTHSLTQLLWQAGFRPLAHIKHGVPRSDFLPLYLTILARVDAVQIQAGVKPEKFVLLKRKMGLFYRRILQRLFPERAWKPIS